MLGFKKLIDLVGPNPSEPNVSVILTIFNQAKLVSHVIEGICRNARGPFELIVVDDSSSDGTLRILDSLLNQMIDSGSELFPLVTRVCLIKSKISSYETACDQMGLMEAKSKISILVQGDIVIEEVGYDLSMINAINADPSLFFLSARGVVPFESVKLTSLLTTRNSIKKMWHKFAKLALKKANRIVADTKNIKEDSVEFIYNRIFPNSKNFTQSRIAGWRGSLLESWQELAKLTPLTSPSNRVWVGEFAMRGPCVIRNDRFFSLGGFNTKAFFLGLDDGDLCLRALLSYGWRAGFFPIKFRSPPEFGSTRKSRSIGQQTLFVTYMFLKSKSVKHSKLFAFRKNQANLAHLNSYILDF